MKRKQDDNLPESFVRAKRHLLLDHPFFGSLVMHLEPVPDENCETIKVNGKQLRFHPEHFNKMTTLQGAGVVAHQIMSCALEHHLRREGRNAERWNRASDYIVNPVILDSGLELPPDIRVDREHADKGCEAVYKLLEEEDGDEDEGQQGGQQAGQGGQGGGGKGGQQPQPGPQGSGGGPGKGKQPPQPQQGQGGAGSGSGGPSTGEVEDLPGDEAGQQSSQAEQTANSQEWQIAVQQAVNSAKNQGYYPAGLERFVDQLMQPKVDWKEELRKFFLNIARTESSWMRPNRRFIAQGLYLPGMRNEKAGELVVAIDTSGSVGVEELAAFEAEVNAIVEDTQPEKVYVIYCDAAIAKENGKDVVEEFTADNLPIKLRNLGGGGTDFRPVFRWIEKNGITPECLVYLTDTYGNFPKEAPEYPVLWAATTDGAIPWGDVVRVQV